MKKTSTFEFILLIAVLITIGIRFGNSIKKRNAEKVPLKGDFVRPNYHAPHPSDFPFTDR
jgi:hypothetical protein